jgi:hypothetical protein
MLIWRMKVALGSLCQVLPFFFREGGDAYCEIDMLGPDLW